MYLDLFNISPFIFDNCQRSISTDVNILEFQLIFLRQWWSSIDVDSFFQFGSLIRFLRR